MHRNRFILLSLGLLALVTAIPIHKGCDQTSEYSISKRDPPKEKDRPVTPNSDDFILPSDSETEEDVLEDLDLMDPEDALVTRQTEVYNTGLRVIGYLLYHLQQDKIDFENLLRFGNSSSPDYASTFHQIEDSISHHTRQFLSFESAWWLILDEIADRLGFDKTQLLDLQFHELLIDLQIYQQQIQGEISRSRMAQMEASAPYIVFPSPDQDNANGYEEEIEQAIEHIVQTGDTKDDVSK